MMPDREKVIAGLECCSACSGDECVKCPYSGECRDTDLPYAMSHLAADALALLKEQKPRVMTLEEARETLHTSEFLYYEDRNDDTMAGGLLLGVLNGSGYWDLINASKIWLCHIKCPVCGTYMVDVGEYMTPDCLDEGENLEAKYGKTFRFWTSRPLPEQMRDTKWEGENNG